MEMIAASKMKKAQERGLAGRPYAEKIQQVIADLAALPDIGLQHPLLQRRPVKKIAVVHITPDRGLCGGLNANLNRRLAGFILEQETKVKVGGVGRKGRDAGARVARETGQDPRLAERRLYLRARRRGGAGRTAAPLRGDGNLPRYPGVYRQ